MAATDVSNIYNTLLKTIYSSEGIEDLTLKESPALGMIPKAENFNNYTFEELLEYGDIKGVGQVFSSAQNAIAGTDDVRFVLTRVQTYALAQMTGEAIEASKGSPPAFVEVLKRQMDSAFHASGQTLSHQLFRNKYGSRGRIGTISTTTITLSNIDDIVHFEKGMTLVASSSDGGALRASTTYTVATVNRDTGVITTTVDAAAGSSWAANDYLYRATDRNTSSGTTGLCMSGFDDWVPASAPSSTAFFGVDRSVDTSRLGGIRYDGSAKNVVEAINGALYRAGRDGSYPETIFMNPTNYRELVDYLGSKVVYCTESAYKNPSIGFDGIKVMGPRGTVRIFPDPFCQVNVAWALTLATWKLRSLGKLPHILNLDGLDIRALATSDGYEHRVGGYYQLGCKAPGRNVRITLA